MVSTLKDDQGPLAAEPTFPTALERTDEYFGDVQVYYDQADISLTVARDPVGPVQMTVSSQGCADAGLCYPPRKQYYTVDMASGVIDEAAPPTRRQAAVTGTVADSRSAELGSLPYMLLLAFLGGRDPQPDALRVSHPVPESAELCPQ